MTVRLRPVAVEDCKEIARLHRACLQQNWKEEDFRLWLERPEYRLLLAEEAGKLAGYVVARSIRPEMEIITLAVDAAFRRQGVARRLLGEVMAQEGTDVCFLEVSHVNTAARALYASLGFEETGRRARYYEDGTDALLMRR